MLQFTDLVGVHFCFTLLECGALFALFRTLLTHNFYARLTMLKPDSNFGLICWVYLKKSELYQARPYQLFPKVAKQGAVS